VLRLHAPAKLNFGLRVVGRRPDGYHLIESLFLPLELGDAIELGCTPAAAASVELSLESGDGEVPGGEANLAVRAARAFLHVAEIRAAIRVRLRKRVPAGAGLGGGSSDAGAVLRGLHRLLPAAGVDLPALALSLGADVPFFLDPVPSRVGGIGERIEPVSGVPSLAFLLVHPGVPLSTARVYAAFDAGSRALTPDSPPPTLCAPPRIPTQRGPLRLSQLAEGLRNDLEPAAVGLCPAIADLRERLREAGATVIGMTGSGPTVFGAFEAEADAGRAARRLRPKGRERVWRTRSVASRAAGEPSPGGQGLGDG
jgi:4-diphosphocytidyl-2-C-methyl-D-erythritol kinase